jgi:hypothetical protein
MYRGMAATYGYDPERVAPDYRLPGVEAAAPGSGPGAQGLSQLPPASRNTGRTFINPATGEAVRSDGRRWVPMRAPPLGRSVAESGRNALLDSMTFGIPVFRGLYGLSQQQGEEQR